MANGAELPSTFGYDIVDQYKNELVSSVQVFLKVKFGFIIIACFRMFAWKGNLDSTRIMDMLLCLLVEN